MALTPEQIRIMTGRKATTSESGKASSSVPRISEVLATRRAAATAPKLTNSFMDKLKTRVSERASSIKQSFDKAKTGEISPAEFGVQAAGDVVAGVGEIAFDTAAKAIPEGIKQKGTELLQTPIGQKALAAISKGSEAYENWKKENPRIAEDVEGVLNLASIFPIGTGGKIGKKIAGEALDVADDVAKGALKVGTKVGEKALETGKDVASYGVTQATGFSPETVELLIKSPEKVTQAQVEGLKRGTLAERIKMALDERLNNLSVTGKEYQDVRKNGAVKLEPKKEMDAFGRENITASAPRNFLSENFGITFDENGKVLRTPESTPLSRGDKAALEEFLEVYGDLSELSSNEFLNARQALDKLASFGKEKTKKSEEIAATLRHFYDASGKEQIPGLKSLDEKFAPEIKFLSKLKSDFFDAEGNLKDTALNKIANLTGKGKDIQLERLEQLVPGIGDEIKVLKAIEDIDFTQGTKVGAYTRGAILGGGVMTGNIGVIIGAIASMPKMAVPLLVKFGKVKKAVAESVSSKLKKGIKLDTNEANIFRKAIEAASASIGAGTAATGISGIKEVIEN